MMCMYGLSHQFNLKCAPSLAIPAAPLGSDIEPSESYYLRDLPF